MRIKGQSNRQFVNAYDYGRKVQYRIGVCVWKDSPLDNWYVRMKGQSNIQFCMDIKEQSNIQFVFSEWKDSSLDNCCIPWKDSPIIT